MNAPKAGGASREVLFRMGIVADPQAASQFKRFGDQIETQQRRILDATKARTAQISQAWKQTGDESVKQFERMQNVGTAAASRISQDWRNVSTTVRRAVGEIDAATATGASRAGAAGRMARSSNPLRGDGAYGGFSTRPMEAISNLASGAGLLARFAGLSGLVGEKDSQKILDTLIKIELLVAGIHGAVAIGKGAAVLASGGAAQLLNPQGLAIAAAAAITLLAGKQLLGSQPGTLGGDTDEGFVRLVAGTVHRESIVGNLFRAKPFLASEERVASQQENRSFLTARRDFDQQQIMSGLERQQELLRKRAETEKEANRAALETANQRLRLAEKELSLAERLKNTREQEAKEARSRFTSDLERFASLDPLARRRLSRIKAKIDRGELLSGTETALAGQFNEFAEASSRSNQLRALAAGGGALFAGGAARAADTARLAQEAAAAFNRSELLVKERIEIVHRIEGRGIAEEIIAGLERVAKEIEKRLTAAMNERVDAMRRALQNKETYRQFIQSGR